MDNNRSMNTLLLLPSQQGRGYSLGNILYSPISIVSSSSNKLISRRKEERSNNLAKYTFKLQTKPIHSELLQKLGHVIFENWEEFCGSSALQSRTKELQKDSSNFIRNSNTNSSTTQQHSTTTTDTPTTQLNKMFGYEQVFSKLCIEQQIHLISNFICNYTCYEMKGSITTRIPTMLYKYYVSNNDTMEQITRSNSPSSPTLNELSNNNYSSTISRPNRGKAPMSRRRTIIPHQVSVLSEIDFQYNEENDKIDSLMVLAFLLDVVLRGCVHKEIQTSMMDMDTRRNTVQVEYQDLPFLKQDDQLNNFYWRDFVCDVLRQIVISDNLDSQIDGNCIDMEMSTFSNDMTVWDTLILRIFKSFLDFGDFKHSHIETVKEQCNRLKNHFKNSVHHVNELLQHDMCRLAFTCQINAPLFQSSFRPTAEKHLNTFKKGSKKLQQTLELSGELPFLTVCYWHSMMCRQDFGYSSPLERMKAFHRMVEKAEFPIKHIAMRNPSESSVSVILSNSVKRSIYNLLDLFK